MFRDRDLRGPQPGPDRRERLHPVIHVQDTRCRRLRTRVQVLALKSLVFDDLDSAEGIFRVAKNTKSETGTRRQSGSSFDIRTAQLQFDSGRHAEYLAIERRFCFGIGNDGDERTYARISLR